MATTGGLFGSKPATGGLFGTPAAATTPATPAGGLFGGAGAGAGTATGTGTATGGAGGLFGSATTGTTPAAGGLFGSKPAATTGTATGTTGGLFGSTTSAQQQQQQQQQAQPSGGLFGSTPASATQPAQPSGGGLFGAAAASTPTTTGTGLFGQAAAPTQQKPAGGLFGQSTAQPPTQVAAVQINYENLRPRSRFDDLAQPVQNEIDLIDKGIQRVIKMRDEIGQFMPQHQKDIEQLGRDVQFVESKFKTVQDSLDRDIQTVKALQDMTKKNIADGQLSFKAADNLKLPAHYHQQGLFMGAPSSADPHSSPDASGAHASAQDLITYFNRICDDVEKYKKRLDEYRSQIERDMPGVENGLYEQIRSLRDRTSSAPVQDQMNQVLMALRETGDAIVSQAGTIAETRERLARLQAGYLDNNLYGMGMTS